MKYNCLKLDVQNREIFKGCKISILWENCGDNNRELNCKKSKKEGIWEKGGENTEGGGIADRRIKGKVKWRLFLVFLLAL